MTGDSPFLEADRPGEGWEELDRTVDELARLAASEMSSREFYAALLDRIVPVLGVAGGAVWITLPGGQLRLECQVGLPDEQLAASPEAQRSHHLLLAEVLASGRPRAAPPHAGAADDQQAANPTDFALLVSSWRVEEDSAGLVELFERPGASPSAMRGSLRFLTAVCELVAEFHRNRLMRGFRQRIQRLGQFEQFVARIYSQLELDPTAYHIANEGRVLFGCDRVSVAVAGGSRWRLAATSGVDAVDRRSSVVRLLERLCRAVAAVGEPLWRPSQPRDLPPEIEAALDDYLDAAHVRAVAVIPLQAPVQEPDAGPGRVIGALVVEQFQKGFDERIEQTVATAAGHCGAALANAVQFQSVPLARLWRAMGKTRWLAEPRQLLKTLLAAAALAGLAAAAVLVPADFRVEAAGELQPLVRRDVFAPYDGIVQEVAVAHGAAVRTGQILVEIRRPELEYELKRVLGELQTAAKRLAAVEAERLQNTRQTDDQRRRHSQLTAEEEELRELIRGLEAQRAALEVQQAELKVSSPIDGAVVTWDLRQLLESRPVARGQILMSVADLGGPWGLEIRVPDDRVAHVLEAVRRSERDLDVSFVLAAAAGAKLRGRLGRLGNRTEVSEDEEAFVPATVYVDRNELPELVPGATVTAKIDCGRRSIGYVWLNDLIDAVRRWVLF